MKGILTSKDRKNLVLVAISGVWVIVDYRVVIFIQWDIDKAMMNFVH